MCSTMRAESRGVPRRSRLHGVLSSALVVMRCPAFPEACRRKTTLDLIEAALSVEQYNPRAICLSCCVCPQTPKTRRVPDVYD